MSTITRDHNIWGRDIYAETFADLGHLLEGPRYEPPSAEEMWDRPLEAQPEPFPFRTWVKSRSGGIHFGRHVPEHEDWMLACGRRLSSKNALEVLTSPITKGSNCQACLKAKETHAKVASAVVELGK